MAKKNARKTVEVGTLLHRVNYFLENDQGTDEEREVMCTFIEGVLHDTGNYKGFRYIEEFAVLDPDQLDCFGSRRFYFVSDKIQDDYDAAADLIAKHYYGKGV